MESLRASASHSATSSPARSGSTSGNTGTSTCSASRQRAYPRTSARAWIASSTLEKVGTDPCSGRPSGPFSGSRPMPAGISPVPSAAGMIATIGLLESMLTAVIAAWTSA